MRYIKARYPNENDKAPVVVKADGLASGKGVIVCSRRSDALDAIDRVARKNEFGKAGSQLIIEDRLEGPEASVLVITDGKTILTLPPAQIIRLLTMVIRDLTPEAWERTRQLLL